MPGPARSPRTLRLLKGTLQKSRDDAPSTPGLPAISETPVPPSWLTLDAAAEFRRLAALMQANGLLTEGKISLLAHVCMIHSRVVSAWVSGSTPSGSLLSVLRRMLGDLGITHVSLPGPVGKPNRFLDNLKRR